MFLEDENVPLVLSGLKTYQMSLISAGSISLDSNFKTKIPLQNFILTCRDTKFTAPRIN
jgi:hypothetical protein